MRSAFWINFAGYYFVAGWTHSLDETQANDDLEASQLGHTAASFHQRLHAAVEAEDREHCHDNAHGVDEHRPEVSELGSQRGRAVFTSRFRRLGDDDGDDLDDRVLEDRDPSVARPVAFALGVRLLLRFHRVEEVFAESARCRGRELDVEQEEGAEADCFVEGADRIDVASDGVVVDLGQGNEREYEGRESNSDDLALFSWRAVAIQVHRDESDGADQGDCCAYGGHEQEGVVGATLEVEILDAMWYRAAFVFGHCWCC